jgi:hypothetical protein
MSRQRFALPAALLGTLVCRMAFADEAVEEATADLAHVSRRLAKEPAYVAAPRYGLFVFGRGARTQIWAVADRSRPDAPRYDVLYWDRNGNGDLTEAGERVALGNAGKIVPFPVFSVGDVHETGTEIVHRGIEIDCVNPDDVYVGLAVAGKYPALANHDATGVLAFGSSPADAPVLNPGGAVTLALGEPLKIDRERKNRIYVVAGTPGRGQGTFLGFRNDFLPKELAPTALLHFDGSSAGPDRFTVPLDYRCCETLFSGPFAVPAGAQRVAVTLEPPRYDSLRISAAQFSQPVP